MQRRIILAGGSGFLGRSLAPVLARCGYEVVVLGRGPDRPASGGVPRQVHWDPHRACEAAAATPGRWVRHLDGAWGIINLAGRSVACRKTPENRREILASRVESVAALAAGCAQVDRPPGVWLQASTAHIYGDTDEQVLDESSPVGTGFAPEVGTAWEQRFEQADLDGCRRVILRISFVLGRGGGALQTLARLARWGLGGPVGSGRQYISWLHAADLAGICLRALDEPAMSGVYVATAPHPVPNREFMRQLRRAVRRPWSPPAPAPLVRLASAVMSTDPDLALLGRRCVPTRLLSEGFSFQHPELAGALRDLLAR